MTTSTNQPTFVTDAHGVPRCSVKQSFSFGFASGVWNAAEAWGRPFYSFGGGRQSCYALIQADRPSCFAMADTGAEDPAVVEYVKKVVIPFCQQKGHWFVWCYSRPGLVDYCMNAGVIPIPRVRWCTDKFKVRPIRKFLRATYGANSHRAIPPINIAFTTDEWHRWVKFDREWGHGRLFRYAVPLIRALKTARDCVRGVEEAGWPTPKKSGCFMCPYKSRAAWKRDSIENPELFLIGQKLEANSRSLMRTKWLCGDYPLEIQIDSAGHGEPDDWEAKCENGICNL